MTIFRLNFLLKVAHILVCQNPSFISTGRHHPATKKHVELIAKENLIQPNLFNKLGPFEFLFLDKEKKSVAKNFDEKI